MAGINANPLQLLEERNTLEDLFVIEQSKITLNTDIGLGQDQQNSPTAPTHAPEQGQCGVVTSAADEIGQEQQNLSTARNSPEQGQCEVVTSAEDINDPKGCCGKAISYIRRNWMSLVNTVIGGIRCIISCLEYVQDAAEPELDLLGY